MDARLGFILMFSGDWRRVSAAIKNVTSFTAVSAVLKQGDSDVTSAYIDTTPDSVGNLLISDKIGGKAAMPAGTYRYFISGTYSSKKRTWYWDILVLPKDLSYLAGVDVPEEDYPPLVEEVNIYEGDSFAKQLTIPGVDFSDASGLLCLLAEDKTATYCAGLVTYAADTIYTHSIGGLASLPAGVYGYFVTGTYHEADVKATWVYAVKVLPKQGTL
jgi:hypothetical protein